MSLGDIYRVKGKEVMIDKWIETPEDRAIGNGTHMASIFLLELEHDRAFYGGKECVIQEARGIPLIGWIIGKYLEGRCKLRR